MDRGKLIHIFAVEGFDYAKALSIIDKILALSEPTLGEEDISYILQDYLKRDWADEVAKKFAGKIARPKEETFMGIKIKVDKALPEGVWYLMREPQEHTGLFCNDCNEEIIKNKLHECKRLQEPVCICPVARDRKLNPQCPIHGQPEKKGKIKHIKQYYDYGYLVCKVNEIIDVVNKHVGE